MNKLLNYVHIKSLNSINLLNTWLCLNLLICFIIVDKYVLVYYLYIYTAVQLFE